jgi:hypothetical protein
MKITDPQVIEDGEKDLIEAVREDLDLDAVRQILKERMAVSTLSSKGGQIVVHNNKIAFRLDFEINLSGSLLFDREGNYIDESDESNSLESEMALDGFDSQEGPEYPLSDDIPLVDTGMNETDLEQDLDDDMPIDLPEYDIEDEPEYKIGLSDPDDLDINALDLETDLLSEDPFPQTKVPDITESNNFTAEDLVLDGLDEEDPALDGLEDDLELESLEDEDLDEDLELDGLDDEDLAFKDLGEDDLLQEERLDDDINDILKESREFWEQKKNS